MKKILSVLLCAVIAVSCVSFTASAKIKGTRPSRVYGVNVVRKNKSTLKVSWGKASGAKGYKLYMKSGGGKYKLIKTTTKRSFTKKGLAVSKSYYFKVRAYKKYKGKTYYGKYSPVTKFNLRSWEYLVDKIAPYSYESYTYYSGANSFNMAGTPYYKGFVMDRSFSDNHYILFNFSGKYNKISFVVGAEDGEETAESSTIMFYSDEELIKTIHRNKDDLPQKVTLNISNTYKFKIVRSDCIAVGFGDVKLYY